jgi:hypothetical protein
MYKINAAVELHTLDHYHKRAERNIHVQVRLKMTVAVVPVCPDYEDAAVSHEAAPSARRKAATKRNCILCGLQHGPWLSFRKLPLHCQHHMPAAS